MDISSLEETAKEFLNDLQTYPLFHLSTKDWITIGALSFSWIPLYFLVGYPLESKELLKKYKEKYNNNEITEKPTFWNVHKLDNEYNRVDLS
jgi:hypothetical protein